MKVQHCASIIFVIFLCYQSKCHAQRDKNPTPNAISNKFAWELFRHSINDTQNADNFVLSPLNVQLLISVLQFAAEGSTKNQIQDVTNHINPTQLYYILNPAGQSPEIKSASAMFIDSDETVSETAAHHIYKNGGDIFTVPLQKRSVEVIKLINSWASNATEGHIPHFLTADNDLSNTRALLVSAIYFHSKWKHNLKDSQPRIFNTPNGGILTDYMEVTSYFKTKSVELGKSDWGTMINLPYKENRHSMFFIVPSSHSDINRFLSKLTYQKLTELIKNPSKLLAKKIRLFLPKFKVSSKISLVSPLQRMGLTDIFSPARSRLTKLLDGSNALFVNEVLQKSTLEIDLYGTTATSVTSVSVVPLSADLDPEDFIIDVPFLSIIVDTANEIPIFISKISNPSVSEQ